MKKVCITFAGAVGSSKTPISNYLSTKLSLPIFNNDAIRSEVIEDKGFLDSDEHINRRNSRLEEILQSGIPFIADISVDRERSNFKKKLISYDYIWFIISIDLSKNLLEKLYKSKGYDESLKLINKLITDHQKFLEEFSNDIGMNILDDQFYDRLEISYTNVNNRLKKVHNI